MVNVTVFPAGDVIANEAAGSMETMEVNTVANCYPGRAVVKDTDDDKCAVSGADGNIVGWLGYGRATGQNKPTTRNTIYTVGKMAPVHKGPGIFVRASLASGQNLAKGAPVEIAAAGQITALSTGVMVARMAESVDASGAAAAAWIETT